MFSLWYYIITLLIKPTIWCEAPGQTPKMIFTSSLNAPLFVLNILKTILPLHWYHMVREAITLDNIIVQSLLVYREE